MRHNFKASLAKGDKGEALLLRIFPALTKLDGRHGDLVLPDGAKVELKTDFYAHTDGGNFFVERYSDVLKGKPGGPWQAAQHGCKWFVYFFIEGGIGYVWDVQDLRAQCEAIESTLKPVEVRNRSWTTIGYKIPRTNLRPALVFVLDGDNLKFVNGDIAILNTFLGT